MAKIVKGKYPYKDTEKLSKKKKRKEAEREQKKLLKKQDKELKMQCDCNRDRYQAPRSPCLLRCIQRMSCQKYPYRKR